MREREREREKEREIEREMGRRGERRGRTIMASIESGRKEGGLFDLNMHKKGGNGV